MLKAVIISGALVTFAASAFAHDIYACKRSFLSADGFTNNAAAESWFPIETSIIIATDKNSWMASDYGIDEKRSKNEAKNNIGRFQSSGQNITITGNKLTRDGGGEVHISVSQQGYKSSFPTKYKCGKASETNWEPQFVNPTPSKPNTQPTSTEAPKAEPNNALAESVTVKAGIVAVRQWMAEGKG